MININLENFIKEEIQCKCGCNKFLTHPNAQKALLILQAFRYFLNSREQKNIRLIISSGVRCFEHNQLVGGYPASYHLSGEAFDIYSPDLAITKLYQYAIIFQLFSTVIFYKKSKFIHVDIRKRKSNKCLSWDK